MDKKNLKIRFISFLVCLFIVFLWAICTSISSNSFLLKFNEAFNVLAVLSVVLMIMLIFSAFINWTSKKSPWYEFVFYIFILIILIFIAYLQIGADWSQRDYRKLYDYRVDLADSNIVGKWINTEDSSVKLIFPNKSSCETYRNNLLLRTDSVVISDNDSICNTGTSIKNFEGYILFIRFTQKTGKLDTIFHPCYAITSIDDTSFHIANRDGSIFSYRKQK